MEFRIGELAERVGGKVVGDAERTVRGVATLARATPDDLSFVTNPRYRSAAESSRAAALLIAPGSGIEFANRIEVDHPYVALAEILELFHPPTRPRPGIAPNAWVAESAKLGRDVSIAPFATIDEDAELGDGVVVGAGAVVGAGSRVGASSELRPGVVLYAGTEVGERCILHSGVVLGGDGYGFATHEGKHRKVPQIGRVVVGDDVEIGANTTVDRAAFDETRIGSGSKIDNLVMVAHGVRLGDDCLLAGQAGIAGSTRVGDRVTFAGQAGAAGHLEIGSNTVVAAKTAVFKDVPPASFVAGIPATDHKEWKRTQVALKRLPELVRELRELRGRVAELERALSERTDPDDR
jgi:UDP-3-O-[3-hydroxymyristoyl] glucosamine N-acyltransferase